jgi:hypothetical protein
MWGHSILLNPDKENLALRIVRKFPNTNGSLGLLPEGRKDSSCRKERQHWFSLLMFDNFLWLLTTPEPAVMSLHNTIQTECCPVMKHRESRKISLQSNSCNIYSKSVMVGWFDVLP